MADMIPCDYCHFSAVSDYDLAQHVRKVHADSFLLSCPKAGCLFRTISRSELDCHISRHQEADNPHTDSGSDTDGCCNADDSDCDMNSGSDPHSTRMTLAEVADAFESNDAAHRTTATAVPFDDTSSETHDQDEDLTADQEQLSQESGSNSSAGKVVRGKKRNGKTCPTEKQIQCHFPGCDLRLSSKQALKRHIKRIHTNDRPFSCPEAGCEYRALFEANVKIHIISAHTNERPYVCPEPGCSFRTVRKDTLTVHRLRKHYDRMPGIKLYTCPAAGCNKQSGYKMDIDRHFLSHHSDERAFRCPDPDCDYRAKTADTLKQHRLGIHYDQMPGIIIYECPHPGCNRRSGVKHHIDSHYLFHHSDESAFPCPHPGCEYRAKAKGQLKVHLNSKHSGE
jgi:hypothetical protein